MYCKKCGRKLRNEARFCDYCGQSTKETRTQSTLKTSGTRTQSSSKTRSDYEKNKKQRQLERERVQKNRRTAFFLLLIAIVAAAVLGFASYNMTKTELDKEKQGAEETLKPESTEKTVKKENEGLEDEAEETTSENTPKPTEVTEKAEEKNDKYYETVAKSCNLYRDDRMDNIRCPYPENFQQGSKANKNTVISLVDPLNDGSMMICAETVGAGKSASVLMKNYAAGIGGSIKTSRAGDGWYEISFERNNKLNHRKAVIIDGLCVYYDFSYDVDSSEASSYQEYIEYIDYYLDKELTSATKKQNSKE